MLTAKRELESVIRDITTEMTSIFVTEFQKIDMYFQQTFTEMFGGAKAPWFWRTRKIPSPAALKSGSSPWQAAEDHHPALRRGEGLVAIALYFSIMKVRPTPFCMLDEIDAALDDRNVERYASYLHHLCKKTQFIVITHRRGHHGGGGRPLRRHHAGAERGSPRFSTWI